MALRTISTRARRWTSALLLAAPLAVLAQGNFQPSPDWPPNPTTLPAYGSAAVSACATGPGGELYVFQRAQPPVLVLDRNGKLLRSWGSGEFTLPHGCRVDAQGNVWLTDSADHRVMKFSPEGHKLLTLGVKGVSGDDPEHFNRPADVAFTPNGDVYIADGYGNSRVAQFNRDGRFIRAWGKKGTGPGEFNLPHSIRIDSRGRVAVADRENARIQFFTTEGAFLEQWTHVGRPYGLHVTADGRVVVSDGIANTVSLYDPTGKKLASWGGKGTELGKFDLPHLLSVDEKGALYVCEVGNKRVQKFIPLR